MCWFAHVQQQVRDKKTTVQNPSFFILGQVSMWKECFPFVFEAVLLLMLTFEMHGKSVSPAELLTIFPFLSAYSISNKQKLNQDMKRIIFLFSFLEYLMDLSSSTSLLFKGLLLLRLCTPHPQAYQPSELSGAYFFQYI